MGTSSSGVYAHMPMKKLTPKGWEDVFKCNFTLLCPCFSTPCGFFYLKQVPAGIQLPVVREAMWKNADALAAR